VKLHATALVLAVVLVAVDLLTPAHGEGWHAWPGFDLGYGLAACVLIVLLSKALGRAGIQQPESFYGEDDDRHEGGAS
jgi:hypothetical protein